MQEATEMATELMDKNKKISTLAERQANIAGTGERKEYAGTLPLCDRCKLHHNGPCTKSAEIARRLATRLEIVGILLPLGIKEPSLAMN
ncbi:hypothetical protein Tco_0175801, partial [Tanacetum coccineum]